MKSAISQLPNVKPSYEDQELVEYLQGMQEFIRLMELRAARAITDGVFLQRLDELEQFAHDRCCEAARERARERRMEGPAA